jgi:hypothetical protein
VKSNPPPPAGNGEGEPRITLNLPIKERVGAARHITTPKKKATTTVEPLIGSDAPRDKAASHYILARCEPRQIRHIRRSAWVEEFLIKWEPKKCTLWEAL